MTTSRAAPRLREPGDPAWPPLLSRDVRRPVQRLWVLGRDPVDLGPCVAIVGARSATAYGIDVGRSLAADLASEGICIVSGMARGIDAAAHEGALAAGGTTIAVLAGGVDVVYPQTNRRLYERIVAAGAVVSEHPPGTPHRKHEFKKRNRIIAGLSHATILVQGVKTSLKTSGAFTTANFAHDFGREVFAVPGDVRSLLSTGPHQLIREKTATLCERAGDVKENLAELFTASLAPLDERPLPEGLAPEARAIMEAVSRGPARPDALIGVTGLAVSVVASTLTGLELRGLIARDPAGIYRRIR